MDVGLVTMVAGGSSGPVAASTVSVAADTQAALASVAASTALSDIEKTTLVAAVAAADSGALTASARTEVLNAVQGLGIYLRSTSNQSWPRWTIMSTLRTYGLNLSGESGVASAATEGQHAARAAAIAAQVQQAVAQVAQSKGITTGQAVVVAQAVQAQVSQPAPKAASSASAKSAGEVGHLVEKVV